MATTKPSGEATDAAARDDDGAADGATPSPTAPNAAEPADTESEDAEPEDAEPEAAESEDAGPEDAEPEDAAPEAAASDDAEPEDTEPEDAEPEDAAPEDAEPEAAASENAASDDAESDDAESDDAEPPARSARQTNREHRAEVEAYATLASTLVAMAPHKLDDVPLEAEARREIIACRPFRKNARIRQLRRIATLLRRADFDTLNAAVADAAAGSSARRRRDKECERWRTRLIDGGDPALAEFIAAHPTADRQQLRQLMRTAAKDPGRGKSQQAFRNLLRAIRRATDPGVATSIPDDDT